MSGWTVVDIASNKSLPVGGTQNSGAGVPYIAPSPASVDAVGKFRVSQPQALIDTDFEYGTQPTKWESIALQNNRQSLYYIPQQPRTITTVTGNGTRTVVINMASTTGFSAGTPIYVQNAADPNANGWWYVESVVTNTSVTYTAALNVSAGNHFNPSLTYVYQGLFYSGCGMQVGSTAFSTSGTTTTVTTTNPHGLSAGSYVYVTGVTASVQGSPQGSINNTAGAAGTTLSFTVLPTGGASAVRNGMTVAGAGITTTTITGTTSATFVANISGTALTYVSGTVPVVGMQLTDSTTPGNLPANVYIVSGTSPNFVLSAAGTTATGDTIVGRNWTVATSQGPVGPVALTINSQAVSSAPNGAWIVATTPTANTFTYTTANDLGTTSAMTNTAGQGVLFARPAGYVESRAFDGGVAFTAGATVPNTQLIRQTRRYFRYQSGKSIQFSTGTSLRPAIFTTSLTSSGTTVTVTTRYNHNLAVGCVVEVTGCDQGAYNGTFTILTTPTPTTFTYAALATPSASPATGPVVRVSPLRWYGSSNRIGMFDQQNGFFFEYDGQTLWAVVRSSSVVQINGTVSVTQGSTLVTGTGTQFSTQLIVGDFIVIRGQTYRIITILSDTQLHVGPEYKGVTISGAVVSRTVETRIPQSQWEDPCNGRGPSGYNIDLTRMQMFYIDYSWYGAGVVRFGLRGTDGQIIYVVQVQNNNIRYEAYMRSGNMASHYESNNITPMTQLTASLNNTTTTTSSAVTLEATTIPVASAAIFNAGGGVVAIGNEQIAYGAVSGNNLINCTRGFNNTRPTTIASGTTVSISSMMVADVSTFAPAGTVRVQASGATGVVEHIAYSGRTNNMLYGLTRAQTGGQGSAQAFTFSASAPISVDYAAPDTSAALSHWGSSVIMDGNFNDDKSLIFNYGTTTAVSTSSTTPVVLMAIRIAPSVDNGTTGLFGAKETINRLQLQLESLGVATTGNTYLINLILNGSATGSLSGSFISPVQLANGITSSLAQIAVNTNNVNVTGGESVAAAYCAAGTVSNLDLGQVRDLGNSILGGGTSNTVPVNTTQGYYPDGPDILYVVAQAVSATAGTILARLSWKEAQA